MNESTRELHLSRQRMASELRSLVQNAEELLRHAVRDAGNEFSDARTRLENGVATARSSLAAAEDAVLDEVRDAARATDGYVRENPWTAIGLGAGLGLLAGLLIARGR